MVFHFTALSPMSTLQWYLWWVEASETTERCAHDGPPGRARRCDSAGDSLPLVEPHLELHALEVHGRRGGGMQAALGDAGVRSEGAGAEAGEHRGPAGSYWSDSLAVHNTATHRPPARSS